MKNVLAWIGSGIIGCAAGAIAVSDFNAPIAAPQAPCKTSGNCTCGDNCSCTAQGECLNAKPASTQASQRRSLSPTEVFNVLNEHLDAIDAWLKTQPERDETMRQVVERWLVENPQHDPRTPHDASTTPAMQEEEPSVSPAPAAPSPVPAASGVSYAPPAAPPAAAPARPGVQYTAAPGYRLVCPTDGSPCYQVPIQQQPVYRQPAYVNQPQYDRRGRFIGYRQVRYYQQPVRYYRYANCRPGGG